MPSSARFPSADAGRTTPSEHTLRSCEKPGLRPGTLQRLRAPDDYRPGSRFLRIRAEADKARYARELPLSEPRARSARRGVPRLKESSSLNSLGVTHFVAAALAAGLEPDRASKVKPYDFRHSVATELTERSGNLLGVGYLLGHRHATTTNQYVHARRRAAESVLLGQNLGQIESGFEVGKNAASR